MSTLIKDALIKEALSTDVLHARSVDPALIAKQQPISPLLLCFKLLVEIPFNSNVPARFGAVSSRGPKSNSFKRRHTTPSSESTCDRVNSSRRRLQETVSSV